MVNILLYAPDGVGCGHVSRMANLAKMINLCIENPYILYVTGYYNVNYFLPESSNIDYVKLPHFNKIKSQKNFGFETLKKNVSELRKAMLEPIFKTISFDYIFVDFFPFGIRNELINILKNIKKKGKVILIQRGIIFSKKKTNEFFKGNEGIDFINSVYDYIVCFSEKKIIDLNNEYFRNRITIPIKYVGYIYDQTHQLKPRRLIKNRQNKILINFGGSYRCDDLLSAILEELITKLKIDYFLTVLLGEYLEEDTKKKIKNDYQKIRNIEILDFLPESKLNLSEYNLIIGCGGYNSTVNAIFNKIPTIVVPKYRNNDFESIIHSSKLSQYSDLKVLSADNLGELTDLVKKTIHECPKEPDLSIFGKFHIPEIFRQEDILL
jgi:predicted glycosyltransferase